MVVVEVVLAVVVRLRRLTLDLASTHSTAPRQPTLRKASRKRGGQASGAGWPPGQLGCSLPTACGIATPTPGMRGRMSSRDTVRTRILGSGTEGRAAHRALVEQGEATIEARERAGRQEACGAVLASEVPGIDDAGRMVGVNSIIWTTCCASRLMLSANRRERQKFVVAHNTHPKSRKYSAVSPRCYKYLQYLAMTTRALSHGRMNS